MLPTFSGCTHFPFRARLSVADSPPLQYPAKAILPTCFLPNNGGSQETMFFSSITGGILMKAHGIFRAGAAVVLLGALAGAPGLRAQDGDSPYSYLFKLRAGLTAGDIQKTHFDNKVMGMAAEVRREMFGTGQYLSAELAFEYVPGRHHDVYPWDTNPVKANDGIRGLLPRYSFDDRKEYGQGLNLKFAYAAPLKVPYADHLGIEGLEWFAGLGIDMFKVASEVAWSFNYTPDTANPAIGDTNNPNIEGNRFVEWGTTFSPGVFGGVKYQLTKDVGFEMSVRNFGMRTFEYTPGPYFGRGQDKWKKESGKSSTGTSRGWALEFALTVKL
jgi:hypothetical protein